MGGEVGQDSVLTAGLILAAVPFVMLALALGIGGLAEKLRGQAAMPWRVATLTVNAALLFSLAGIAALDHLARDWSVADLIVVTCLPLVTTSLGMIALVLLLPRPRRRAESADTGGTHSKGGHG